VQEGTAVSFKVSTASEDSVALSVEDLPQGALFDSASGQFDWTPGADQEGVYALKFTAKTAAQAVTQSLRITVDSGTPSIDEDSRLACSSGAIGTLTGRWLGPNDPVVDSTAGSLELAGTVVRINGRPVPVLSAARSRVSFLCPQAEPGETLQLTIEAPSGTSRPITGTMRVATPSILTADVGEQALVFHGGTPEMATVRDVRHAGYPAQPGDLLSIQATGLASGLPLFARIGGVYAEVVSVDRNVELAGVWDVRVKVPAAAEPGDAVPVQLELGSADAPRSNCVTIPVEAARF
jgi:uncharacterized protein (TIGR03437 family)